MDDNLRSHVVWCQIVGVLMENFFSSNEKLVLMLLSFLFQIVTVRNGIGLIVVLLLVSMICESKFIRIIDEML